MDLSAASLLLVDDNPQNLELMQAYVDELGCQVETATDGVEAMEAVRAHTPDLILLDIMMPRMSGYEVCRALKGDPETRDIIIVMVTALNEVGDFERAVECGTNDFISKPVNRLELLVRLRSLLELRLGSEGADIRPRAIDVAGLTDEGDQMLPPPEEDGSENQSD